MGVSSGRMASGGIRGASVLPATRRRGRIVGMPPIRRVLVLAVDGVQSLDVLGPVEIFFYANQQVPGSYRVQVAGPASDGQITMSNGLKLGVEPLPEPPPRHDTL